MRILWTETNRSDLNYKKDSKSKQKYSIVFKFFDFLEIFLSEL